MNNIIFVTVRFIILIVLQVFVCNYIHLFGFINPNIYLLALLLLPFETPKSLQYLIAFTSGFLIDMFAMTYGVNASAALLLIFVRPYLVKLLNGRRTTEGTDKPTPSTKDLKWMLIYTFVLVFIYQLMAYMLELFSFRHFLKSMGIVLINTLFTSFVILCIEYILIPVKKK
ncbi:MAG: rod shape-determining protein MreD [Bacteroidales bacterium]